MRLLPRGRQLLPAPAPPIPPDQRPATLDLIYTEIKERLQDSSAQANTLDTKAGFVLTAASLLITVVTGAQAAVATHRTLHVITAPHIAFWSISTGRRLTFTSADAMHLLTGFAGCIYIWIVWYAWRAYMVRKFKIISAEILYDYTDLKYTEEWQVKKMLTRAMRDQYTINQEKIDLKSHQVELALRGLLGEVLFLALILLSLIFL